MNKNNLHVVFILVGSVMIAIWLMSLLDNGFVFAYFFQGAVVGGIFLGIGIYKAKIVEGDGSPRDVGHPIEGYRVHCVVDAIQLYRDNCVRTRGTVLWEATHAAPREGAMLSIVICIDPGTGMRFYSSPTNKNLDHIKAGMNIDVIVSRENPSKYYVEIPEMTLDAYPFR